MLVFLGLSLLILVGNALFTAWWKMNHPPPEIPKPPVARKSYQDWGKLGLSGFVAAVSNKEPAAPVADIVVEEKEIAPAWFTLGKFTDEEATSANPVPRMLVTLNNAGGTIERIELNRYPDLEDWIAFGLEKAGMLWNRAGYLGNLAPVKAEKGVKVQVVPPGTPADAAGLKAGDVIIALANSNLEKDSDAGIKDPLELFQFLGRCKPESELIIKVNREGSDESLTLTAKLGWRPVQVIRPELDSRPLPVVGKAHDPFSLALQMARIDDQERDTAKALELDAAELKTKPWAGKQIDANTVEFTRELPKYNLRLTKRYELLFLNAEKKQSGYEIRFSIQIENTGDKERKVAYELGGPNGMPIEGWWYLRSNRIGTAWGQHLGLRDAALRFENRDSELVGTIDLVSEGDKKSTYGEGNSPLVYAGVDCQYFAAVLIPRREKQQDVWFEQITPEIVGTVPTEVKLKGLANASCAFTSKLETLPPGGRLKHTYDLFVGPKQPEILDQTGSENTKLDRLVYFGWKMFSVPAHILLWFLHVFHSLIPNYGINIIMLTIFVRMCLFPLSKKQANSAEKMKLLQPQIAAIKEKYKGKSQEITLKTQELFRKNKFNPLGGCLPAFLQLPIFMGLYRALMVDVELRDAPLFSKSISWCSNLGAPDMLWYWEPYLPAFLGSPTGWLGPFLNIMPLFTVFLFLKQQKSMMPPATDDQTRMQQSMMKYMTILMAFMFYNVACGLCLYFIVSSLWGMAERKYLKKTAEANPAVLNTAPSNSNTGTTSSYKSNGSGGGKSKKQRGRR